MPTPESNTPTQDPAQDAQSNLLVNFGSSMTASTCSATMFHPWDRAQFLAMYYHRAFLCRANFTTPFQGLSQTMCQKPFAGSMYYFVQEELKIHFAPYLRQHPQITESQAQFVLGLATGAICGVVTNPLSCVKANTWQSEAKKGAFVTNMITMWKNGGVAAFTKGTPSTLCRDMIFGSVYECFRLNLRYSIHAEHLEKKKVSIANFSSDATAAGIATVASSLFNYARTIQHGTPPDQIPPSMKESITSLVRQIKHQPGMLAKASFFQRTLCIGPGTARVALGMATGQFVADGMRAKFK